MSGRRSADRRPTVMIKAIAFDLWETLITNTLEVSRAHRQFRLERMQKILGESGFAATTERIEGAYRDAWRQCHERYWASDKDVPCRRQIDHFLEALEFDPASFDESTAAALEQAYARAGVEVLPLIVPGADVVIPELKRRGYRLGLISNTGRTPGYVLREILDHLGLRSSFAAMVFSNEHGECKPQRSIFEALRRSLQIEFDEMLFIGDNLYVDVHGAKLCGMHAVHFAPLIRGTAVAPAVDINTEPDATIRDLQELLPFLDAFSATPDSAGEQKRRS